MSRIYRSAVEVIVWLGSSADDSDYLFDLLNDELGTDSSSTQSSQTELDDLLSDRRAALAFIALCRRPYWQRVWIIQEIFSSRHLRFYSGTKHIPGRHLNQVLVSVWKTHSLMMAYPAHWTGNREALEIFGDARNTPAAWIMDYRKGYTTKTAYDNATPLFLNYKKVPGDKTRHGKDSFSELLELCAICRSECEDVRDKIYGLVSIVDSITKSWKSSPY